MIATSFRTQLEDAMQSLKDQLVQREEQIQQDAANREHIKGLQEKLKHCDERIADMTSQLSDSRGNEKKVKYKMNTIKAYFGGAIHHLSVEPEERGVYRKRTESILDYDIYGSLSYNIKKKISYLKYTEFKDVWIIRYLDLTNL